MNTNPYYNYYPPPNGNFPGAPNPMYNSYAPPPFIPPQMLPQKENIILAKTYLPESYYDDVIDNLELITLHMINDIKTLTKKQKSIQTKAMDSSLLKEKREDIRETFDKVEEKRDEQQKRILTCFQSTKERIRKYLDNKFPPLLTNISKFNEDITANKDAVTSQMKDIDKSLYNENEDVKKLLTKVNDPFIKYSAEKVYYPRKESELEFAMRLAKKYQGDENELPQSENEPEPEPEPVEESESESEEPPLIEVNPNPDEAYIDGGSHKTEVLSERSKDSEEEIENFRKFRSCANSVLAIQKCLMLKTRKIYERIRNFNDSLLNIEEYIDTLLENLLQHPFEVIIKHKTQININKKIDQDKLDDFILLILNTLLEQTTQVKINRTFAFFFKRYIFNYDFVPKYFFSLFERRRIKYVPNGEMNHSEKQFVLIMKIIINIFVYENLLSKALHNPGTAQGYNFKLIASLFYHKIILYYQGWNKQKSEFTNDVDLFLRNTQLHGIGEYDLDKIKDDERTIVLRKELKEVSVLRKEEIEEAIEYKNRNYRSVVTYNPDTKMDEIEEISKMVFSKDNIQAVLYRNSKVDIMKMLLVWVDRVIGFMDSHHFGFND
jgi:hypothetical protein